MKKDLLAMKEINQKKSKQRFPQIAKEPLLRSHIKGNPENRVVAKFIDIVLIEIVVFLVAFFSTFLSYVVTVLLWGLFDKLGRGQSPGKWLLGLHTVEVERGYPPSFYQGLIRNFCFIALSFGFHIPSWWGSLLLFPVFLIVGLEVYFIFSLKSGIRFADVLSATRVADYKDEHTQFIEQFLKEDEESSLQV
jgi:hypothetical protein